MEAVDKISVGVSKEKAGQNTQEAITENADGMKVSLGEKICYGVGDIGANLVWTTVASFLTIYCTDVAGIAAGIVGTLMLIARLFDGVSDLFMGIIIDKTNTRWGKSRPWILPALSEDPHERTVLASCRTFFSSIGSTVVSAFALTLVDKFGNGNEALGFRIVMIIFGVIGCLVFFFCFFNTKERVVIKQEKVSLKANISCLLHNKPWKLFALNIVWFFGGFVIQASAVIYYFTYVVQNTTLVQIVATITTLVPIVTNLCAPFLVKLTTKRNLMVGGSFVHMGGLLIIFFGGTNVPVLLAGAVIAAAGYGMKGSMHFAMQPDPVDYGEWKSGVNTAGTLSAVNGFVGKVGMAIASSVGAAMLQFGGFDATQTIQTVTAQHYITAMYIWVPIITNIATIVTMMFYDLDKIYPQIIKELDERRANA